MRRSINIAILLVTCISFVLSCSGGGIAESSQEPPVTPDLTSEREALGEEPGHNFLGYNLIFIDASDPENVTAEMVPARLSSFHLNILKLLEAGPCTDCFKITNVVVVEPGILDVDIKIIHPFDDLLFTVFDVRGIMMFDGNHPFPSHDLTMTDPESALGAFLNPDGYTYLYNGTTIDAPTGDLQKYYPGKLASYIPPNATLNGYIRHSGDAIPNSRNALYGGDTSVMTYRLKFFSPSILFGYAVDANWDVPSQPVTDPMVDFPETANSPEPWKVEVEDLGPGLAANDPASETTLSIKVYDWQGKSTHALPKIECPEIFNGTLSADHVEDGPDYARYQVTLSNSNSASTGFYNCLVSIEDNDNNSSPWWLDLTAYQIFDLPVGDVEKPPTAILTADKYAAAIGEEICFDGSASHDNDEGGFEIVKYEWAWFNGDVWHDEGAQPCHSWDSDGTYDVQLRVTDDEGDYDIEYLDPQITIDSCPPPTVNITDCNDATSSSKTFHWDMSDPDTPVGQLKVEVWEDANGPIPLPDGTQQYTWNGIECGPHFFKVQVTNDCDLSDISPCDFERPDTASPTVTLNCTPPNFSWTMSDDCTPNSQLGVEIRKDGGNWQTRPPGTTSENWDPNCGTHTFEVRVRDESNQTDTDGPCTFPWNDDNPYVEITNKINTVCDSGILYKWNMSDDCTPVSQLQVYIKKDSGSWEQLANGTDEYLWSDVSEGSHTFSVRVKDNSGNNSPTDYDDFYKDGSDPTASFVYPDTTISKPCISMREALSSGRLTYNRDTDYFTYTVSVTVSDSGGLDSVEFTVNGITLKTWYLDGETSMTEDYDWVFRTSQALSGYRWEFGLEAVDECGQATILPLMDVFTFFMPGWPSGQSGVPGCYEVYNYGQDGVVMVGIWSPWPPNIIYCNAIQWMYDYQANIFETDNPGDSGQITWWFELDEEDWWQSPYSMDYNALIMEAWTYTEGENDFKIMIWDNVNPGEWRWIWNSVTGDKKWGWHSSYSSASFFNDLGSQRKVHISLLVPNFVDNFDGVDVNCVGMYFER